MIIFPCETHIPPSIFQITAWSSIEELYLNLFNLGELFSRMEEIRKCLADGKELVKRRERYKTTKERGIIKGSERRHKETTFRVQVTGQP